MAFLAVSVLACLYSVFWPADGIIATVYLNATGTLSVVRGVLDKKHGVAYGSFVDDIDKTGWSQLDIRSGYGQTSVDDATIMYSAGYLEGAITAKRIHENYQNLLPSFEPQTKSLVTLKEVEEFMHHQFTWMRMMILDNTDDPFWKHVGLIYSQFEGLLDGYNAYCLPGQELNETAFQLMNGRTDISDIVISISPEMAPEWDEMTLDEIRQRVMTGHCSALVKATPGYEDILAAHSTWTDYSTMLRVFKHYSFNLREPTTGARSLSFSGYPGILVSIDDYYILGSRLIMLETTNSIYNNSLYKMVTPESLLPWQRVRVASQMAHDATEWTDALTKYNSGTYNNQYMVVDLNKIRLEESIEDNALRIAEQIPGLVVSGDVTPILRAGYFASYNVPFFEKIYNLSGYPEFVAKHGVEFSYQLAPRAEIFRRDQSKVVDINSMQQLLRYNNYENEKYADDNPCKTICCRGDLSAKPYADGCTDTKVTNYTLALSRVTHGISGPTTEGGIPAFSFTGPFESTPHQGMPLTWDFPSVTLQPDERLN